MAFSEWALSSANSWCGPWGGGGVWEAGPRPTPAAAGLGRGGGQPRGHHKVRNTPPQHVSNINIRGKMKGGRGLKQPCNADFIICLTLGLLLWWDQPTVCLQASPLLNNRLYLAFCWAIEGARSPEFNTVLCLLSVFVDSLKISLSLLSLSPLFF